MQASCLAVDDQYKAKSMVLLKNICLYLFEHFFYVTGVLISCYHFEFVFSGVLFVHLFYVSLYMYVLTYFLCVMI